MTLFRVEVEDARGVIRPSKGPVIFHACAKSGSLAMANVLQGAYAAAGREQEFRSHYHGVGGGLAEYKALIRAAPQEPAFYCAHYLFRAVKQAPDQTWVTQLRHPLPRVVSCHHWMRRRHIQSHGSEEGFPSLEDWLPGTRGRAHAQFVNLGVGFVRNGRTAMETLPMEQIFEQAVNHIETRFQWYGLAEYFEESIFCLARLCGLPEVPAWRRDDRNVGRPRTEELPDSLKKQIWRTYEAEFDFYELMRRRFLERLGELSFGPDMESYRRACVAEYKDRLTGSAA